MDERQATRLLKRLRDLDTLTTLESRFTAHVQQINLTSAIERYGASIVQADMLAQIVRPLIADRAAGMDIEQWIARLRAARDAALGLLAGGHWRANGTNIMQNAISQWQSEAMVAFVEILRSAGLE